MSVQEIADYFGISRHTVYRRIRAGELHADGEGDALRVPVASLLDCLDQHTVTPEGSTPIRHREGDAMTQALPKLHPFPLVAEQLGIPLRQLRERSWKKKFKHLKFGGERYFTAEQLEAFLKSIEVTTEAAEAEDQRAADLAATAERVARSRRGRKTAGAGR